MASAHRDRDAHGHVHGFLGAGRAWAAPALAAFSDEANRADQGNETSASEYLDADDVVRAKAVLVAELLRTARACVAYTGAGLSRASGIPDYATRAARSVSTGVAGAAAPQLRSSLHAQPTVAHRILANLVRAGFVRYWVQQNHDGLPQKAGVAQEFVNEIHGAWMDPSNPVVKFSGSLRGDLFKDMLAWEERADLCLCLGTSLSGMNADRVARTPAKKSLRKPPEALGTVIVNLQATPLDARACVRVWARLDDFFALVARELGLDPAPRAFQWTLPPGDVFPVPYNKDGALDRTVVMKWDLRTGQEVRIAPPKASNAGARGRISGKDAEGNYMFQCGAMLRPLGRWWVDAALRGAVPLLPLVNVSPRVKPAPPPEPALPEMDALSLGGGAASAAAGAGAGEGARGGGGAGDDVDADGYVELRRSAGGTTPEGEGAGSAPAPAPSSEPLPALPRTIRVVQLHRPCPPTEGSRNTHRWGLRVADDSLPFVASVVWGLHPTFRCPRVRCNEPPFDIERIGWGTFDVDVTVVLRREYGARKLTGVHTLDFSREGDAAAVTEINCDD